jgi:uncharacterized membrane protein YccC
MALGLVTDHVAAGLFGSLGTLLGVLAERSGTTGQRVTRICTAAFGGVVAMVVGRHTAGTGVLPLLVVLCFACVSGVVMQGVAERTSRRYRAAVAGAVSALAGAVRDNQPGLLAAQLAISEATDLIAVAIAVRPGQRRELEELFGKVSRMGDLGAAAAAATWRGSRPLEQELASLLDQLAEDVVSRHQPPLGGCTASASLLEDRAFRAAYAALLATAHAPSRPRSHQRRAWIIRLVTGAVTGTVARAYTARLVLCMGAAEIVRQADPVAHDYWVLITVGICLKPDFQSVLARTLQRVAGTVASALLAVVLLRITSDAALLATMGVLACGIPYAVRRNYGLFAVLITPIVLILLHFGGPVGNAGVVERVVNTVLGGAVVLVFGYVLWPGTWRPPSRARISRVLRGLASCLDPLTSDVANVRRLLYSQLADLRTVTDHGPYDPPACVPEGSPGPASSTRCSMSWRQVPGDGCRGIRGSSPTVRPVSRNWRIPSTAPATKWPAPGDQRAATRCRTGSTPCPNPSPPCGGLPLPSIGRSWPFGPARCPSSCPSTARTGRSATPTPTTGGARSAVSR